ncbi:MAG: efflux RND transporter periplasmic adaptor subunit [Planctomycetota bacterium]
MIFKTLPDSLLAVLLTATGLLSLTLTGCNNNGLSAVEQQRRSDRSEKEDVPRVQTIPVKQQDLEQKIELPGTVEGFETADLYAKVGGYLEEISVDIGDRVTRGQVLARLSVPEMVKELRQKEVAIDAIQAEVKQAQAAIKQAQAQVVSAVAAVDEAKSQLLEKKSQVNFREAEYSRISELVKRGSLNKELLDEITYKKESAAAALEAVRAKIRSVEAELAAKKTDVEKARADFQTALAHVELAKADYERVVVLSQYSIIKAPFDGVVTNRMVDPGAFIQPADGNSSAKPLLTVSSTAVVRISLDLPMAQVRWLDRDDRVILDRINVLPGEQYEGQVTRFSTILNKDSRMMRVEIDLKNPDHRLMPGYYGYVTLFLNEMPQQMVIPSSALLVEGDKSFVFIVDQGKARKRLVKTNFEDGSIVGIQSGISPGDLVIQAGGGLLVDGQSVIAINGA